MADVAIRTHELSKRYRLGTRRRGEATLSEYLSERARSLLTGRLREPRPDDKSVLWALRDVSIEVPHGEVLGLIGHNGAGKSTLLKILTRITEPTSGWGEVTGRVGSLLEVGTGFHPELTGRENIFLNGSILGMSRAEIRRRFDEIVDFAEVERFLDTPVKRYSSGMSVRLAFAVAAHLEPEILLVDEVLAVGDAAFQRKSLGKMSDVAAEGRTVVFVSHNLAIIRALCRRAILLERGRMVADGPTTETVDDYLRALERSASEGLLDRTDRDARGNDDTLVSRIAVHDVEGGLPDVVVGGRKARVILELTEVVPQLECRLTILDNLGQPIATLNSEVVSPEDTRDEGLGPRIECDIDSLPLLPGRYRLDFLLKGRGRIQDGLQAAAFFDVEPGVVDGRPTPPSGADGNIVIGHRWRLPS